MKQKRFVIGDIHGRHKALLEVLKKSKFNYKKDKLIVLGDVVDGGYNTYLVIEELLKIKNLIFIMGNHDEWFVNHIKTGWADEIWVQQGGANTLRSYGGKVVEADFMTDNSKIDTTNINIPVTHQEFFNKGLYWYIEDNKCFVHGGFNPKIPKMESQSKYDLVWDRTLIDYCKRGKKIKMFDEVFIGHTSTQGINNDTLPINYENLWCLDTGGGWIGKLTIMNIDTKRFWQSNKQDPAK